MPHHNMHLLASRRRARDLFVATVLIGGSFCTCLGVASKVHAVPEAEAFRKLEVIPAFVLTDDKHVPLVIPTEKGLVVSLYLERAKAYERLAALQRENTSFKAVVAAIPLNVMIDKVAELGKQLKDRSKPLFATVIANEADRRQAVSLLKEQGLADDIIDRGLIVPVFFVKNMKIKTSGGPRDVFYMSYQDLQNSLDTLPVSDRDKFKPQVADLTAVLREIIKAKDDGCIIFPSPEYFRLVKEAQSSGKVIQSAN